MRYDDNVRTSQPWGSAKWPRGAKRNDNNAVHAARWLLRQVESASTLANREERDKNTERGLAYVLKRVDSWMGHVERYLSKKLIPDVRTYVENVHAHAQAVIAALPEYVAPVVSATVTEWTRSGRYDIAGDLEYTSSPHVDIMRLSRRRDTGQVRVSTDGDNLHRASFVLNEGDSVELVERGSRGTLFLGS